MLEEIEPVKPDLPAPRRLVPPAPIHALSALTTIVLDNVFGWVEIVNPLSLLLTCLGVGMLGFLSTLFVQHYLSRDSWGESLAKGVVMGVLSGVPYQVTGTAVGALLLGWAGANKWIHLPPRPVDDDPGGEIVEAEARDPE